MNDNAKVKFYIDKTGFFAESAMLLLVLAAIFRVIGCWGMWNDRINCIMLLLLPVFCCLLLALCVLLLGKKGFCLSFIPVLLGMVFFVYNSFGEDWLYTVLYILLELVIAVVYTATVFGWIRTKWILLPLFAIPFLYRLIMVDIPALGNTAAPVTFADGMQEMSVLFILAALFCISMGLKKRPAKQKAAETETEEPAPAPAPQPVSIPQPAAQPTPVPAPAPAPVPAPAPAPAPAAPAEPAPAAEPEPFAADVPYTPVLTLEPEPWEPEEAEAGGRDESEHE